MSIERNLQKRQTYTFKRLLLEVKVNIGLSCSLQRYFRQFLGLY